MRVEIDKRRTGIRLSRLMDERKISVKEVQRALGLNCVQSVYQWMNGKNLPSVENLYALSEILQVPIDELVCGNRPPVIMNAKEMQCGRITMYYRRLCDLHIA